MGRKCNPKRSLFTSCFLPRRPHRLRPQGRYRADAKRVAGWTRAGATRCGGSHAPACKEQPRRSRLSSSGFRSPGPRAMDAPGAASSSMLAISAAPPAPSDETAAAKATHALRRRRRRRASPEAAGVQVDSRHAGERASHLVVRFDFLLDVKPEPAAREREPGQRENLPVAAAVHSLVRRWRCDGTLRRYPVRGAGFMKSRNSQNFPPTRPTT